MSRPLTTKKARLTIDWEAVRRYAAAQRPPMSVSMALSKLVLENLPAKFAYAEEAARDIANPPEPPEGMRACFTDSDASGKITRVHYVEDTANA